MQRPDVGERAEIAALCVPETGEEIPLPRRKRVLIGSGPGCDIVLRNPDVSAIHCAIERHGSGGAVLRDEWSVRGTFVNGKRARLCAIEPGALLRIGGLSFVVVGARGRGHAGALAQLVGQDPAFRRAIATAMQAAVTDCSVLILGETGTGKELVAQAIHEASPRADRPVVALNCGAIPGQLIGSELFGHEKGAFTGAATTRDGMFVHACGGTLFLDELGELPAEQQPHLLRVLETRRVRRLGSNQEQPIDVRLIAATNRIEGLGSDGARLRLDLYHRVATVIIELPPLRARPDDIPLLVRAFMDEFGGDFGHRDISRATLLGLRDHPWPGNVRELRSAVQRAMALCPRELALEQLVPGGGAPALGTPVPALTSRASEPTPAPMLAPGALTPIDRMLRDKMLDALDRWGSIRRAAQSLGMPKSTFADRARRLGIRPERHGA